MATTKTIGDGWTWFEDYVFAWATWTVNCPRDRTCQVGMGIFTGGNPLGEKIRFSGSRKITTLLAGSIHIRVVDDKGPCVARLDTGDVGLIDLPPISFP